MPKALPIRLNLARLADARAVLEGDVPLSLMERLVALLANSDGSAHAHLEIAREAGRETVRGKVEAELALICQRCLGPLVLKVDLPLDLARVADEADAESIDDGRDSLLAPNREVLTAALIEDELILAIPLVPRHGEHERCENGPTFQADRVGVAHEANAFNALAKLKTN